MKLYTRRKLEIAKLFTLYWKRFQERRLFAFLFLTAHENFRCDTMSITVVIQFQLLPPQLSFVSSIELFRVTQFHGAGIKTEKTLIIKFTWIHFQSHQRKSVESHKISLVIVIIVNHRVLGCCCFNFSSVKKMGNFRHLNLVDDEAKKRRLGFGSEKWKVINLASFPSQPGTVIKVNE